MQVSPFPCHLVPLRSKYSSQHPILKHPQPAFLPQFQRPGFTPIQNYRQNLILYILIFKFLDSNLEDKITFHLHLLNYMWETKQIRNSHVYCVVNRKSFKLRNFANTDFCCGAANCSLYFWNMTSRHRVIGSLRNFLKNKPIDVCFCAK